MRVLEEWLIHVTGFHTVYAYPYIVSFYGKDPRGVLHVDGRRVDMGADPTTKVLEPTYWTPVPGYPTLEIRIGLTDPMDWVYLRRVAHDEE
jgi:hypothetical protein